MNRSISSVLVLLFGALVTALSLAYQSGPDDKSLPDPNQVYTPSDEEKASAKVVALMASRTNTLLSIPMLMCMVGQGHGLPF